MLVSKAYSKLRREGVKSLCKGTVRRAHYELGALGWTKPLLTTANIELTNVCDLRCEMCAAVHYRTQTGARFIPAPQFKIVVDQLAKLQCNVGMNFGGESLLHPDFPDLLRYVCAAKKRGVQEVSFFDNAMRFDADISKLAIGCGLDRVIFSFNGLKEANNKRRRGSNYDLITENIERLLWMRRKRTPAVWINLIEYSREETNDFLKVWLPKVDAVMVSAMHSPQFHIADPSFFSESQTVTQKHCPYPFYSMGILADGTATSCCSDSEGLLNLGNVFDSSVKEVWAGQRFRDLRARVKADFLLGLNPCERCNFWRTVFKTKTTSALQGDALVTYRETAKTFSLVSRLA